MGNFIKGFSGFLHRLCLKVAQSLKGINVKKALTFSAALMIWDSNALAASLEYDQISHTHFEDDSPLMHDCLETVATAELHFFWTTGRTLGDNDTYGASREVAVGGAKYGKKFFPYVGKLLAVTPDHLKVKFVCDDPTKARNQESINDLLHHYGDRFEILPSESVHQKLLATFPLQEKTIDTVFRNATAGNPAIPSDIYRPLMPYGRDLSPEIITQTQFTYCDIDTFCDGMDTNYNDGHKDLICALFDPTHARQKTSNSPFCLERSSTNTDLIKLNIKDIGSYKAFCEVVLEKVLKTTHTRLLTMFSDLHNAIKNAESEGGKGTMVLGTPEEIRNIMYATGPGFLDCFPQYTHEIGSYPHINTLEWHGTQLLAKRGGVGPLSSLGLPLWGGDEELCTAMNDAFTYYQGVLASAMYAKPFGENHPFNLKIRKELQETFPYTQPFYRNIWDKEPTAYFKHIIKESYGYEQSRGIATGTVEEWLARTFNAITTQTKNEGELTLYDPYYIRLTYLLKQVGVDIPFTVKDIDFREN